MSTIQCDLYCKLGAKYSAHSQVYAVRTVVPAICNVVTTLHIQALIFSWIFLRCYWTYGDIWKRVLRQIWCQIHHTFSRLRHVNCGPGHIQCSYISAYSGFSLKLNVSALLLEICRQFNAPYTAIWVPNTAHILQFTISELLSRTYIM
jgi:hypothetical protein